jgi:hypothetical protein
MINIVPVKKIVEFRRLPERSKLTFANNLKLPKKSKSDDSGGGDYWIRSISGISNAYKDNDKKLIQKKIDDVLSVYNSTNVETTKTMYKRNLEILHNYIDFDFSDWRPPTDFQYLANPQIILNIKGIPIRVIPHHVFSFEDNGEPKVVGIWFVTWWAGFKLDDLGIYSEALFRYLSLLYSKEYNVDPNYCIIVDTLSREIFRYTQILNGNVPPLLESTIDTLVKYLS